MKCLIFLHSTTGNTRLVTSYASWRLGQGGHESRVHDIVDQREAPSLDDVELLGVACPTMYFRPTVAMERFVASLPVSDRIRPAFLLATAGGMVGAHFSVLAEALWSKGWVVLGAHMVPCVDNWPIHHVATSPLRWATPLVRALDQYLPFMRWYFHWLWPSLGDPGVAQRDALDRFLERVASRSGEADLSWAPQPGDLEEGGSFIGKAMTVEKMRMSTTVRIDPSRCTACGLCVTSCPSGAVTVEAQGQIPRIGPSCMGCWACYNRCPDGAISGMLAPRGLGRYPGPSRGMRDIFAAPLRPL